MNHLLAFIFCWNSEISPQVFAEFRGTTGKFTRHLTHQMDSAVPSAFIATLPPFQFHSGSTETFNIKGPDIGELIQLTIQVMVTSKKNVRTCIVLKHMKTVCLVHFVYMKCIKGAWNWVRSKILIRGHLICKELEWVKCTGMKRRVQGYLGTLACRYAFE